MVVVVEWRIYKYTLWKSRYQYLSVSFVSHLITDTAGCLYFLWGVFASILCLWERGRLGIMHDVRGSFHFNQAAVNLFVYSFWGPKICMCMCLQLSTIVCAASMCLNVAECRWMSLKMSLNGFELNWIECHWSQLNVTECMSWYKIFQGFYMVSKRLSMCRRLSKMFVGDCLCCHCLNVVNFVWLRLSVFARRVCICKYVLRKVFSWHIYSSFSSPFLSHSSHKASRKTLRLPIASVLFPSVIYVYWNFVILHILFITHSLLLVSPKVYLPLWEFYRLVGFLLCGFCGAIWVLTIDRRSRLFYQPFVVNKNHDDNYKSS